MATLPVVLPGLLEEAVEDAGVSLPIVMPLVLAAETTGAELPKILPFVLDAGPVAPSGLLPDRGYFLFDGLYRLLTPDAPIISTSVLPSLLPFVLADPIITGGLQNGDTLSGGIDSTTTYTDTYSGGTDSTTTYGTTIDGSHVSGVIGPQSYSITASSVRSTTGTAAISSGPRNAITAAGVGLTTGAASFSGDTALTMFSIRSSDLTSRMSSSNTTVNAIANKTHSAWAGDWIPTANIGSTISGYVTAANGVPFTCVLYAIPNRDSGGYSAGGFANRADYLAWITAAKNGAGTAPVWWILEPDALGFAANMGATAKAERQETLRQAVVILAQNTNARIYIDASQWVAADTMAGLLNSAGIGSATGISCNVSNFMTTSDMATWAEAVLTGLVSRGHTGKKYVIDTSRNGNGPLPSTYTGSSIWHSTNQTWCNPPGRGAGPSPRKPSGRPNCDAYLWIKNIGQSDGEFPTTAQQTIFTTNAPIAGSWWTQWFDDYVSHTPTANLSI